MSAWLEASSDQTTPASLRWAAYDPHGGYWIEGGIADLFRDTRARFERALLRTACHWLVSALPDEALTEAASDLSGVLDVHKCYPALKWSEPATVQSLELADNPVERTQFLFPDE